MVRKMPESLFLGLQNGFISYNAIKNIGGTVNAESA